MMTVKPDAKECKIREQIIEDMVTGLTLQFRALSFGECELIVVGDLPFGNREFTFDKDGVLAGTGTALGIIRDPSDED